MVKKSKTVIDYFDKKVYLFCEIFYWSFVFFLYGHEADLDLAQICLTTNYEIKVLIMRKRIPVIFLSFFMISFLLVGCGGKYSDVKKVNEKYIALMEDYITDIDKADNADDAAKAVNKFADGLEALLPEMQGFSEKYPELKDKSNPPEALKEIDRRVKDTSKKMVDAMMKLMPYMMHPKVLNAEKRLGSIMTKK